MKIDTTKEKQGVFEDVLELLKKYPYLRKSDNALFVKYCEVKGTIGIEFGKVEDKDAYRTLLKLKTLEQNIKKGTYGK